MKTDGTNGGNSPTATEQKAQPPALAMKTFLESKRASFEELFPTKKQADRFMRILIALPILSPAVLGCTKESILNAAILCARDGLEPDGRHAALVPFAGKAVYMAMVHGYIRKAHDTGLFRTVTAREVYANDEFSYRYDFDNDFRHVPAEGDRGELAGCYGFYVLKAGGRDFIYMTVEEGHAWAKAHASNAVKAQDSLYHRDFRAWLLKTVVRRVLHFAPIDSEISLSDEDGGMRDVTPGPTFDPTAKDKAEDVTTTAEPVTATADGELPLGEQPGEERA